MVVLLKSQRRVEDITEYLQQQTSHKSLLKRMAKWRSTKHCIPNSIVKAELKSKWLMKNERQMQNE